MSEIAVFMNEAHIMFEFDAAPMQLSFQQVAFLIIYQYFILAGVCQ